jgi:hypothetical protein
MYINSLFSSLLSPPQFRPRFHTNKSAPTARHIHILLAKPARQRYTPRSLRAIRQLRRHTKARGDNSVDRDTALVDWRVDIWGEEYAVRRVFELGFVCDE